MIAFNMTNRGYPPFMIHGKGNQPPGGIMYDVLQTILSKHGIEVKTLAIPKKRELLNFRLGKLDAHATAVEWVASPDDFIFTDPILKIRNVLYSKASAPVHFSNTDDLVGMKAISRLGFIYPPLTEYFADGRITRQDVNNELSMLKMILSDRGDFAIVNDAVGAWLVRQYKLHDKFAISEKNITNFDFRIMFTKKWKPLVRKFNQELAIMKKNGDLLRIFKRYGYVLAGAE